MPLEDIFRRCSRTGGAECVATTTSKQRSGREDAPDLSQDDICARYYRRLAGWKPPLQASGIFLHARWRNRAPLQGEQGTENVAPLRIQFRRFLRKYRHSSLSSRGPGFFFAGAV